ncbi:MAG: hypothetical protein HY815_24085 [Candidatus Riflebacteria bacterium]|nr:hypothetical protein [Candidatus Riflebacteria bacterium]
MDPDQERISQLRKFLDRYTEGLGLVCLDCLTEFVPGTEQCSDCSGKLLQGASAVVALMELVDPDGAAAARRPAGARRLPEPDPRGSGRSAPDAELDESPEAAETPRDGLCPGCGAPLDPESGACESCLLQMVREGERIEGGFEPDPAELERVELLQEFLADVRDRPGGRCCPSCLSELVPGVTTCEGCAKEAVPLDRLLPQLRDEIRSTIAGWFVPLVDASDLPLFDYLLEQIEKGTEISPVQVRISAKPVRFSAVFGHWSDYARIMFIRRQDASTLLTLIESAQPPGDVAPKVVALMDQLRRIAIQETDDVWCPE